MTNSKTRCFIISPIGEEGSGIRQHADDVLDYIVKPALEKHGIEVVRSDHLREPGRITEQMFREILTDQFCIALLTGHNPNVFYELAVAQAAAKPVIVLLEKGEDLPFDIRDLRCVYYDLQPRPLFEGVYTNEIAEHVSNLASMNWQGATPWQDPSGSLDAPGSGMKFTEHSVDFGNPDRWADLLRETSARFDITGISLGRWRKARKFSELLQEKANAGCRTRILLMHPENPIRELLINPDIPEERYNNTTKDLVDMHSYYSDIAQHAAGVDVRQLRTGCPHYQITITDGWATFVPYLYSDRSGFSPLWQYPRSSGVYEIMRQEFEALWNANASDK